MAMNGEVSHANNVKSPTPHLGKRKRNISETSNTIPDACNPSLKSDLQAALQLIQKHDPNQTILRYELPVIKSDSPALKKVKTEASETTSIEHRFQNNFYGSLENLIQDLDEIILSLKSANGHSETEQIAASQVEIIRNLLTKQHRNGTTGEESKKLVNGSSSEDLKVVPSNAQVLSVRSQTESGIRQLFSGLSETSDDIKAADGRKLPNGFELTDISTMDRKLKEHRTFGDVFAPHRNAKPLEAPRVDRRYRNVTTLEFITPFSSDASNQQDARNSRWNAPFWLRYATVGPESRLQPKEENQCLASFKAAYSSFAPSMDSTTAFLTATDSSREWHHRFAKRHRKLNVQEEQDRMEEDDEDELSGIEIDPEQVKMIVENFITEKDLDDRDESEKVLDEISELLETLSSHQLIRDSEHARGPVSANKPTKQEYDIFETLRLQLQLLISTLPPFAVAKLNGDQLEHLNLKPNIMVEPIEFIGTGQPDEYTTRRVRAAQAATNSAARTNSNSHMRPTATPTGSFSSHPQAYNRNVPPAPYTARPNTGMYTPRQNNFAQTSYNQSGPRPTIQQYQRAMANGYAPGGTPAQGFMARPSQPGYQQHAQDRTAITAGAQVAQNFIARQYNVQAANHVASPSSTTNRAMTLEQMRVQQDQQASAPRHMSNTPQPQSASTPTPQPAAIAGTMS